MSALRLRIGLALVWLALGVGVLLWDSLFPADVFARHDKTMLTFAGWLAVGLAVWNGIRAYRTASVNRVPAPNPLRHERSTKPAGEYNPEFDFGRPSNQDTGGKPITSTD